MVAIEKLAGYIYQLYEEQYRLKIDEMKLHKLLYFLQRENFASHKFPLFEDKFKAWQFGPVLLKVRDLYKTGRIKDFTLSDAEVNQIKPMIDFIFDKYARKSSWSLSSITHGEHSWQRAIHRSKIYGEPANMLDEDIEEDAIRIKLRRLMNKN